MVATENASAGSRNSAGTDAASNEPLWPSNTNGLPPLRPRSASAVVNCDSCDSVAVSDPPVDAA